MKYLLLVIFIFSSQFFAFSQDADSQEPATYMTLSMGQDPAFGFYPSIAGGIGINEKLAFTYYGIFWTQDALAGNIGGIGLLTEFGVGLNYSFNDGKNYINPSLGLGNGKYQSGGARAVIGDAIVPSIYAGYKSGNYELNVSGIAWLGFRKEELVDKYRNQYEYLFNFWYAAHKYIDFGLYFDHFLYSEDDNTKVDSKTGYLWVGPSVRFKTKSGASFWFTFGPDFVEQINSVENAKINDYYKIVFSYTF